MLVYAIIITIIYVIFMYTYYEQKNTTHGSKILNMVPQYIIYYLYIPLMWKLWINSLENKLEILRVI